RPPRDSSRCSHRDLRPEVSPDSAPQSLSPDRDPPNVHSPALAKPAHRHLPWYGGERRIPLRHTLPAFGPAVAVAPWAAATTKLQMPAACGVISVNCASAACSQLYSFRFSFLWIES